MLGVNHFSAGALAGLATLPLASPDPKSQTLWVLAWGAAALIPDLDTGSSSASRAWGPITGVLSRLVSAASGGHRRGTHDLILSPLGFGLIAMLCLGHSAAGAVLVALLAAIALRGLKMMKVTGLSHLVLGALSLLAGIWQYLYPMPLERLPLVVAGGVLCHLLCDCITVERLPIPILWIFGKRRRWGIGLFRVGSRTERWVLPTLFGAGFAWFAWRHIPAVQSIVAAASVG